MTSPQNIEIPGKTAKRIIIHFLVLSLSLITALVLIEAPLTRQLLENSQGIGFVAASFISGILFTSLITSPLASTSLFLLGEKHHPLLISTLAALGSALGDAILLKIVRDDLTSDLEVLTKPFIGSKTRHLLQSKILHFPLAILGAVIIASPLPDEIGISIFGLIKYKPANFYVLSFILNFLGILGLTTTAFIF